MMEFACLLQFVLVLLNFGSSWQTGWSVGEVQMSSLLARQDEMVAEMRVVEDVNLHQSSLIAGLHSRLDSLLPTKVNQTADMQLQAQRLVQLFAHGAQIQAEMERVEQLVHRVGDLDPPSPSGNKRELIKDCADILEASGRPSGTETIYPAVYTPLAVYCDQDTDGGGWTVVQRRQDGSVDFFRDWADYQTGFGDLGGEFWLGLEYLHSLTSRKAYELRVDVQSYYGNKAFATYSHFLIAGRDDYYRLHYDNFTGGDAGDSLGESRGQQFTTRDADHDYWTGNCANATKRKSAGWFKACSYMDLNASYKSRKYARDIGEMQGVEWYTFQRASLNFTEMKIRPM